MDIDTIVIDRLYADFTRTLHKMYVAEAQRDLAVLALKERDKRITELETKAAGLTTEQG